MNSINYFIATISDFENKILIERIMIMENYKSDGLIQCCHEIILIHKTVVTKCLMKW